MNDSSSRNITTTHSDDNQSPSSQSDIAVPFVQDGEVESRPSEKDLETLAQEREERLQAQARQACGSAQSVPLLSDRRCNHEEHSNPKCICNTSDDERAELLRDYLEELEEEGWLKLRLMPVGSEGKTPVIAEKHIGLEQSRAYKLLHSPAEAIEAIRQGAVGFCLYADKPSHNTEGLVFTDRDEPDRWPDLGDTLRVVSGSGTGDHLTFINAGDVECAKGKGDLEGIGSIRGNNWFVVLPGSVHPSGGIYHMVGNPGIAELSADDLPRELQPDSIATSVSSDSTASREAASFEPIKSLPDEFNPDEVTNDVGMNLKEVCRMSKRLDRLLIRIDPAEYESISEADQATVRLLLIWRFEETDIAHILRACRYRRGRVDKDNHPYKMQRDDYVRRTIRNTAIPYPVDSDLAQALLKDAKETDGQRPSAGPRSLREVQTAFTNLGAELTVNQIAESTHVRWGDATKDAVKRRIRRCLSILEDAGFITWYKDGRRVVYVAEGITELRLPGDVEWQEATSSLINQSTDNRGIEANSEVTGSGDY